jgi:hypothetical protein
MVDQNRKRLLYLFAFIIVINWLFVGTLSFREPNSWWGEGWGPRYLVVLLPFITLMVGSLLVGLGRNTLLRYSVIALSAAGFCITVLGVLVWTYYDPVYLNFKQNVAFEHIWNMLAWNPVHTPIVVHAKILYENYVASIPVQSYFHTYWHGVTYGLAPCPIDNYIYCTYGTVPAVSLLVLAGVVMAVILRQVNVLKHRNRIATAIIRIAAPNRLVASFASKKRYGHKQG